MGRKSGSCSFLCVSGGDGGGACIIIGVRFCK